MSNLRPTPLNDKRHQDSIEKENRDAMAPRIAAATAAMADAYAGTNDTPDIKALRQQASSYNPDLDAEIERLKAMPDDFLSPNMRMSIGLHESAKAAAAELNHLSQG